MKKIISTAILSLGLLQGANTAYAEFAQDDVMGHYGGTFYGNIFQAKEPGESLSIEVGTLTLKHIGEADGITYTGEIVANTTVANLPAMTNTDAFECEYQVSPTNGQVDFLNCSFETSPLIEITGNLQCVLIPPKFGFDPILHNSKGDLDCVGTLDIEVFESGTQLPLLFVANVIGEINNRD